MKTHNALLAFSFFFFLALFGFTRAGFILDSEGHRLNNEGTYYILPPVYGGESIKAAAIRKGGGSSSPSCSLAVAVLLSNDHGWATKIATPYPLSYITNDYPLNISFATLPPNVCTNTPNWVVTGVDDSTENPVMVGKPQEFSDPLSGDFYIKQYASTEYYKFAFCYSKASCGYVTFNNTDASQSNIYRLFVTQDRSVQPLVFKFVKAAGNDVVSGISMVV